MEDSKYKKAIEIFTSIDLEMNQPSGKIIQIGAVVGNIKTGEILDSLSVIVNPHEQLGTCNDIETTITELTGITQEQVDAGVELEEAYLVLRDFHKKHGSFINPITWGGGDAEEVRQQLESEFSAEGKELPAWCFGRRWIDAKTLFVSWRFAHGQPIKSGLAKAMLKVGLRFQGRKHNALDDAKNTFIMYKRLLELFKPFEGETGHD